MELLPRVWSDDEREGAARRAARALIGVCDVGSGPTDEQYEVIRGLMLATLNFEVHDVSQLEPIPPEEIRPQPKLAARAFVQAAITLEFCRHPPEPAMADKVDAYSSAVGGELAIQATARNYLESDLDRLMANYTRYRGPFQEEIGDLEITDSALAAQMRDLRRCRPGSLGRAFYDFHVEHGFRFPGEEGGGARFLIPHDFTHVITGYPPDRPGEIAVNALACATTGGERYFGSVCSSLALHEGGLFRSRHGNTPGEGSLRDPEAIEMLADAVQRGLESGQDPMVLDHMELVDVPVADIRGSLELRERRDAKAQPRR